MPQDWLRKAQQRDRGPLIGGARSALPLPSPERKLLQCPWCPRRRRPQGPHLEGYDLAGAVTEGGRQVGHEAAERALRPVRVWVGRSEHTALGHTAMELYGVCADGGGSAAAVRAAAAMRRCSS